jgi:hypothetical protein
MRRRHALSLTLAATFSAGCGHTVGALEVASRATVEFDCSASHLYVQSLARNHYSVAGCGRRAIFICQSGACERDSEVTPTPADARVVADGNDIRNRLNQVHAAVLACVAEEESTPRHLEFEFATDGTFDYAVVGARVAVTRCLGAALGAIPPASHAYEHPLYLQHRFSQEPWRPLPAADAAEAVASPASQPDPITPASPPASEPPLNEPAASAP